MELKKLYSPDGEFALVEPGSQAEDDFKDIGYTDKEPRMKPGPKPKVVKEVE